MVVGARRSAGQAVGVLQGGVVGAEVLRQGLAGDDGPETVEVVLPPGADSRGVAGLGHHVDGRRLGAPLALGQRRRQGPRAVPGSAPRGPGAVAARTRSCSRAAGPRRPRRSAPRTPAPRVRRRCARTAAAARWGASHASRSARGAASRECRWRCPSTRTCTRPASPSTRRCRVTAGRLVVSAAARSPAATSPSTSSSRIRRRVGSATATATAHHPAGTGAVCAAEEPSRGGPPVTGGEGLDVAGGGGQVLLCPGPPARVRRRGDDVLDRRLDVHRGALQSDVPSCSSAQEPRARRACRCCPG